MLFWKKLNALNYCRRVSSHKAQVSDLMKDSLTELSVICATAEERETRFAGYVVLPRLVGTSHERSKQLY